MTPSKPHDSYMGSRLHYRRGILSLGNPNLLQCVVSLRALCSKGRNYHSRRRLLDIQTSLKNQSRMKMLSHSAFKMCRNVRRRIETSSKRIGIKKRELVLLAGQQKGLIYHEHINAWAGSWQLSRYKITEKDITRKVLLRLKPKVLWWKY